MIVNFSLLDEKGYFGVHMEKRQSALKVCLMPSSCSSSLRSNPEIQGPPMGYSLLTLRWILLNTYDNTN